MGRKADILIPVYRDPALTESCVDSVYAHSGEERGQVIIVNDCSPDPAMVPMLENLYQRYPDLILLRNEKNVGFVGSVNRALELRQRNVVLLNNDARVTQGWLAELLEVAYLNDRIACVCPLSNNASICSVPDFRGRNQSEDVDSARLELDGLPRYTIVPTGVGFCLLIKNVVLNMIGTLDPAYGRGYNEENDWAMRARAMGFIAARANRAFVYHVGEVSFGGDRSALDAANVRLLSRRYPHFEPEVASFCAGVEARVASLATRSQASGLSACIDLRHVPASKNGTAVYGFQLVRALKHHTTVNVSALAAHDSLVAQLVAEGVPSAEVLQEDAVQVLHRPAQVFNRAELRDLLAPAAHAVITFQDLIAFRTPGTARTYDKYREYRAASFAAVHSAQAVIALSEHNRSEIVNELGVPPERVHVVHHGVDAVAFARREEGANRRCLEKFQLRRGYFLNAGNDYPHKNVRLLLAAYGRFRAMNATKKDLPDLVLFGPATRTAGGFYHLPHEAWVSPGVRYLGVVDDAEVKSLYQEAGAFVFPSAYEGFGLPVLEAMAAGAPVICSSLTAVPEVAGEACLSIRDFTPDEIATHLGALWGSAELRARLVAAGHARVRELTWEQTARRTAAVYEQVVRSPSEPSLKEREVFSELLRHLSPD